MRTCSVGASIGTMPYANERKMMQQSFCVECAWVDTPVPCASMKEAQRRTFVVEAASNVFRST
jgi:hypothetical protein